MQQLYAGKLPSSHLYCVVHQEALLKIYNLLEGKEGGEAPVHAARVEDMICLCKAATVTSQFLLWHTPPGQVSPCSLTNPDALTWQSAVQVSAA